MMNKQSIIIAFFLSTLFTLSCTSEATLFGRRAVIEEQLQGMETFLGYWIAETQEDLVIGIQLEDEILSMKTQMGQLDIVNMKKLGDLYYVLEVKNGTSVERLIAKFESYEKTSLTLMNVQVIPGMASELTVTLLKAKEEAILTASSRF